MPDLLLAGAAGWRQEEIRVDADPAERSGRVRYLGYVELHDMPPLYAGARALLMPSIYEGFGMPVAEAIASGLVPLVSRNSVLHEVAGDSAVLVDPDDTHSIAAGMVTLVAMNADDRATRLGALQVNIARFDIGPVRAAWHKAFDDILSAAEQ